jgi:hypothetical protein
MSIFGSAAYHYIVIILYLMVQATNGILDEILSANYVH